MSMSILHLNDDEPDKETSSREMSTGQIIFYLGFFAIGVWGLITGIKLQVIAGGEIVYAITCGVIWSIAKAKWILYALGAILLIVAMSSVKSLRKESSGPTRLPLFGFGDATQHEPPTGTPEEFAYSSSELPPASAHVRIHVLDLLRNPFQHQHELIELNTSDYPVMNHGVAYMFIPADRIHAGVQLERMMERNAALFNVMGLEPTGSIYDDSQTIGQIMVIADHDPGPGIWSVEPLGVVSGTNGFGAPISIPLVKFWATASVADNATAP